MKRKCFLAVLLIIAACSGAFAKSVTKRSIGDKNSWQESFDINDKKDGKYNVIVTAKDKAGNETVAGPFNIKIDENSDKPIIGITNPIENMRVPGNLNIVGTCIDDDSVDHVNLILDGNNDDVKVAEGKEFWSYYLDTNSLVEGPHTIEAWGVDVNGKPSDHKIITWQLDRRAPITEISNIGMGTLVSGKIKLEGFVKDGNGIKKLEYSVDGGNYYTELSLKEQKLKTPDENGCNSYYYFSIPIDTLRTPDGPAVCWIKATDMAGTVGLNSFLYFIDNTKPEVKIVYPTPEDQVNGTATIAGYAKDIIGIESLTWKFGKEEGEFELIAGNPYFVKEVNLAGLNGKQTFTVTAKDIAGNIVSSSCVINVVPGSDAPVATIISPVAGSSIAGRPGALTVRGVAKDDDGIAKVTVQLDNGATKEVESKGPFCVTFEEAVSYGPHIISVFATDINGTKGPKTTVAVNGEGGAPAFGKALINGTEFYNGMELDPETNPKYTVSANSALGLNALSYEVIWSKGKVTGEAVVAPGAKSAIMEVPLNTDEIPYGISVLKVTAEDTAGNTSQHSALIKLKNLSRVYPKPASYVEGTFEGEMTGKIIDINGAEYKDAMTVELNRADNTSALAQVTVAEPIVGIVWSISNEKGNIISQGKLDAKKDVIPGEEEGVYEFAVPLKNMPAGIAVIKASVSTANSKGDITGVICVVRENKSVSPEDDKKIYWGYGPGVKLSGNKYLFENGAVMVGYANRMDGNVTVTSSNPSVKALAEGNLIKLTLEKDGEFSDVVISAVDKSGNRYTSPRLTLAVNNDWPVVTINSPKNTSFVKNSLNVSGSISAGSGIKTLEYSMDNGETWKHLAQRSGVFAISENISSYEEGGIPLDIRVVDTQDKEAVYSAIYVKDTVAPEVKLVIPEEGDIINGENVMAFLVKDDGSYPALQYAKSSGSPWVDFDHSSMPNKVIGGADLPLSNNMVFRATDAAGNVTTLESKDLGISIDSESDLPRSEIHLPLENEVITRDFVISGVIYDDDGASKIYYKIDNGDYVSLDEYSTSFMINVPLSAMTDNEHTVYIYSEDRNGVKGKVTSRKFRISLNEPKGTIDSPTISETIKGTRKIVGTAYDENGIDRIEVSLDNGETYNIATGQKNWEYTFDTHALQDGTHVVFVRIWDKYGITGVYSTLINIDNTNPEISLELPLDDSKTTRNLFFSGRTTDNIGLTKLYITVRSLSGKTVPDRLSRIELTADKIISQVVDISSLDNGFYNIELTGEDAAGNITRCSRNIQLDKNKPLTTVDLIYPLNGEVVTGVFNIFGKLESEEDKVTEVELLVDGKKLEVEGEAFASVVPTINNYFKFHLDPTWLEPGKHSYKAVATTESGKKITSREQELVYKTTGPWVTLDNFDYGNYASNRPLIKGNAGYSLSDDEVAAMKDKTTSKEKRAAIEAMSVARVYMSFDNGKTYSPVSKINKGKWEYRIEDEDIDAGYYFVLIKAEMKNGEKAVTRTLFQIDHTNPSINLISPGEGGRYNQELQFAGLTSDDVALNDVQLILRSGDKNSYGVPKFIQGLYLDGTFWGASLYSAGIGLTAFDNAVKIQGSYGQFTQSQRDAVYGFLDKIPLYGGIFDKLHAGSSGYRFGGDIISGKIIAQLGYLPFRYLFGRDFDWLSATLSIGANFSWFSKSGATDENGEQVSQIISSVLAQIEFPRITFKNAPCFKTWAIYYEPNLWFIPSDVASSDAKGVVFTFSIGGRVNLF